MYRGGIFLLWNNHLLRDEQERRERNQIFNALKVQRRVLRDMTNVFLLPPDYFARFYRMPPGMVFDLIQMLERSINDQGVSFIPVHLQVLCALRFFAEGSFQKGASQDFQHPVGQSTFSRCLNRVVNALCLHAQYWIRFPATSRERSSYCKVNWFRFAALNGIRIPGIIGLIDCTVVKLIRPSRNEEAFYNHEHKHSLNIQVICGGNKVVYDIRICPGSNNDRAIWKYSEARHYIRSLRLDPTVERHYYLLGDSGYNPSPVLLTPIRNAIPGSREALYTRELCTTRCIVEQLFGDFSNIFISSSRRRVLYYHPQKAAKIVLSIAVLHNFKILGGIRMLPDGVQQNIRQVILRVDDRNEYQAGLITRQTLLNRHYNV